MLSNAIEVSKSAKTVADENNFEIKAYAFKAKAESSRKPRIVKVIYCLEYLRISQNICKFYFFPRWVLYKIK